MPPKLYQPTLPVHGPAVTCLKEAPLTASLAASLSRPTQRLPLRRRLGRLVRQVRQRDALQQAAGRGISSELEQNLALASMLYTQRPSAVPRDQ